ncbi:MAG: hypothetical protein F4Y18_01960 [Cenarchaeum sp. SB0663_bin_5]|nr:hypothetical protein [Cenarchaeum sp. SB0663_bin_5]MYL10987.1 hypothetical protein [Cenarchaeum sp. SB0669_bin_11]
MPMTKDESNSNIRKFGVVISTTLYNAAQKKRRLIVCRNPKCQGNTEGVEVTNTQYDTRQVYNPELIKNGLTHLIGRVTELPTWACPHCNTIRDVTDYTGKSTLEVITPEPTEPNPLKIVPKPPREADFTTVNSYHEYVASMRSWLILFNGEVLSEITAYREYMISKGLMYDESLDSDNTPLETE